MVDHNPFIDKSRSRRATDLLTTFQPMTAVTCELRGLMPLASLSLVEVNLPTTLGEIHQ